MIGHKRLLEEATAAYDLVTGSDGRWPDQDSADGKHYSLFVANMVVGYVEAAMGSTVDAASREALSDLPYKMADAEWANVSRLCAFYFAHHALDLMAEGGPWRTDPALAGHDLLMSRNGEGTGGFQYEDAPLEVRNRLWEAAVQFGPCLPYIDYDGRVVGLMEGHVQPLPMTIPPGWEHKPL